jgi:hypothetical protein
LQLLQRLDGFGHALGWPRHGHVYRPLGVLVRSRDADDRARLALQSVPRGATGADEVAQPLRVNSERFRDVVARWLGRGLLSLGLGLHLDGCRGSE